MQPRKALFLSSLFLFSGLSAQDTLRVSLPQADSLLVNRSLALLAKRYDVDAATADRIQARLFNNPTLSTEWGVLRPGTGKVLNATGPEGEMAIQVEQLFRIAGQRNIAIKAAEQRIRMNEAEYADLASSLRLQLHADLYRIHFLVHATEAISSQLAMLKRMTDAYGPQLDKGNVSLRDVARLRTSYFALNNDRSDLLREINRLDADIGILVGTAMPVRFLPSAADLISIRPLPADTGALIAAAMRNHPRILAASALADASDLDLKLARREAVPDLAVGGAYDSHGSVWHNYTAVTLGISIPIFNRNQGQILRNKAMADQARSGLGLERLVVKQEVVRAYKDLLSLQDQYTATSVGLADQLDHLSESLINNYIKSNLSLVEFTDLFESYNTSIIAINKLEADLQGAYGELEYATGQALFNH